MGDLEIKLPKILEREKIVLEKRIEELITFEAKRRRLLVFIDEIMKGAKQLPEKELISLGRELKHGRFKKLKKQGLV